MTSLDRTASAPIESPRGASAFSSFVSRYATILTIASFLVVSITGVLVFFHIGNAYLMDLHNWIGMFFVGASAFHVVRHLKPFTKYFTRTRTKAVMAGMAAVTAMFITAAATDSGGGNPVKQFAMSSIDAPISALAPVVGKAPDTLMRQLNEAGFNDIRPTDSVRIIAKKHGVEVPGIYRIVVSPEKLVEIDKKGGFSSYF